MANALLMDFLNRLQEAHLAARKIRGSESLYEVGEGAARIYFRYSRIHQGRKAFYGLRQKDLKWLEGGRSFICFLWEGQKDVLLLPFEDYEHVFGATAPASDGQYKVQLLFGEEGTELYVAKAGRFNVDAHWGRTQLHAVLTQAPTDVPCDLSHAQAQTILGAIGSAKGYDVWIPPNNREGMDWSLAPRFEFMSHLPSLSSHVDSIAEEVDVIWMRRGAGVAGAAFEVEHSTPVYSGLLRLNDIHLMIPHVSLKYGIVSNQERRDLFLRQINRPTFTVSGLSDLCTFMDYRDLVGWYRHVKSER